MSDFIDWDERLGEVRGRTLPEILLNILDAAEGDRDRLKTSWMISDLENFERATISRQAEAQVKMPGTITGSPLASVRKVLMEVVDLSKQVIEVSILDEVEVQPTTLKFTPPTEEGLYESAGQVWELQDDGFWNELHGDGAEFGDHPFVKLVPVTTEAEHLATTADGLRSCAGCSTEPLQECYVHGESAARFYIDHAISAMYHFAGIEQLKDDDAP